MAAPIVVGTSMLDSKGKVKGLGAGTKSGNAAAAALVAPYAILTGQKPPAPLPAAPSPAAGQQPGNQSATDAISSLYALATKYGPGKDSGKGPLPMMGPTAPGVPVSYYEAKNKKPAMPGGVPTGYTPLQFAAALKLATKQLGGFDTSPFDTAKSSAKSQAHIERKQSRRQGARAEADDAILYGRLANYINKVRGRQARGDSKILAETRAGFETAKNNINNQYNQTGADTSANLSSRGIANNNQEANIDRAWALGNTQTNKATSSANVLQNKRSAGDIMRQTGIDARTEGTGKVASEKAAVNTALENIALALQNQLGSIGTSQASAESDYNSKLRALAASLQATDAATGPNSQTSQLNDIKIAEGLQKLNGGAATMVPSGPGQAPVVALPPGTHGNDNAQLSLQPKYSGIPKDHTGTLLGLFNQIINNSGPFNKASDNLAVLSGDSSILGHIMTDIHAEMANRQGYGDADQQALRRALMIYLGKY